MKKVLEDSGYLQMLQEDNETDRMENIKELLNDMQQYIEDHPDAGWMSICRKWRCIPIMMYSKEASCSADDGSCRQRPGV